MRSVIIFRGQCSNIRSLILSLFLCAVAAAALACGSKPVDPRTVVPADSLVYLETSDLGRMLDAVVSSPKFTGLAKTKPDVSAMNGIRLSIAVTGFQTSDEPVSEDNAVLNFKPRFVAVAETNAWNSQALGFTENKIGEFVNDIYGGEVELITTDKHNGKYFTWTAKDGRKAFALVRGSLILFGNDETAIDNCVNVMNGGADSIAKNSKVSAFTPDALASGYVSKDGVAQIANIAAVSLAVGAGEEGEVKNFISRVLPEIARNSINELTWTAKPLEGRRLEDSYVISVEPETARVLSETVVPGSDTDPDLSRFVPSEFVSAARYNLKDAQIAWRSVLLTARTKTDQVSGGLLSAFSSSLFEPYGIEDPETFLSGVGGALETIRFDPEGEEVGVVTRIKDLAAVKKGIAKELDLSKPPERFENADIWRSADGELAAAIVEGRILLGDAKSVERCLAAHNAGTNFATVSANSGFANSSASVVTFGSESDNEAGLVSVLSDRKDDRQPLVQNYTVESRFNQNGIERRTVSDLGLIGAIIARLDPKS